ncbi:hypothetical protein L208DRAFT_1306035 [Tricholoma matsutake]|nr:hypothetical protein L208DRAFT_1306035 [Tricholoma matsutake 945]
MNLGDGDLQLLCVIEGETKVFPIDIEGPLWCNPKFMVGDLKEKIQEERKYGSLAGIGAHSLVLWMPKEGNSINLKPKQTLPGHVMSIRESGEELDPGDSILTIFPDQFPLNHLHIVVQKPDTGE